MHVSHLYFAEYKSDVQALVMDVTSACLNKYPAALPVLGVACALLAAFFYLTFQLCACRYRSNAVRVIKRAKSNTPTTLTVVDEDEDNGDNVTVGNPVGTGTPAASGNNEDIRSPQFSPTSTAGFTAGYADPGVSPTSTTAFVGSSVAGFGGPSPVSQGGHHHYAGGTHALPPQAGTELVGGALSLSELVHVPATAVVTIASAQ